MKRPLKLFAPLITALLIIPGTAVSQDNFPNRPIKLVVTHSPGSTPDVLARALTDAFAAELGQPVVVENRAGARGTIAATSVARSARDGYTLLMGSASVVSVETAVTKNLPYNSLKDFAPVGIIGGLSPVIVVRKDSSIRSLADLAEKAAKAPGQLTFGSSSQTYDLIMAMFKNKTRVDIRGVPYKAASDAMLDLLAGRIDVLMDTPASAMPHLKAGSTRALAVLDPTRAASMPDASTAAESGFPELTFVGWTGLLAPAGTPEPVLNKLHAALEKVVSSDAVRSKLLSLNVNPVTMSREQFAKNLASDIARFTQIAESAGIRIDR